MPKTVLVVDDEQDIVDLLRYNFTKGGYRVLTAGNGEEALEKVKSKPDLILLDVMMPKMDGHEVVRHLKRNVSTANIPIIFLTAKGMELDEVVGLELGAEDYIVKPISMARLMARVKTVLRRERSIQRNAFRNLLPFLLVVFAVGMARDDIPIGSDRSSV